MSILLFVNLKGGVAKTTNAVAVGECLASAGHRVLVIDADHQCMASELLLGEKRFLEADHKRKTLHDLLAAMLSDEFSSSQIDAHVEHQVSNIGGGLKTLSVIPCSVRIDDFQTNMAKARKGYRTTDEFLSVLGQRKNHLRKHLKDNYDFTIVDCPPSISVQVKFLLGIADHYVIPCIPDRLSVRGSLYLLDRFRRLGLTRIKPLGTLWTLFRQQNGMHVRVLEKVQGGAKPYNELPAPFETIIPNASAIAESTEIDQPPASFVAKYTHQFAKVYRNLCDEIVKRAEWSPRPVAVSAAGPTTAPARR